MVSLQAAPVHVNLSNKSLWFFYFTMLFVQPHDTNTMLPCFPAEVEDLVWQQLKGLLLGDRYRDLHRELLEKVETTQDWQDGQLLIHRRRRRRMPGRKNFPPVGWVRKGIMLPPASWGHHAPDFTCSYLVWIMNGSRGNVYKNWIHNTNTLGAVVHSSAGQREVRPSRLRFQ